MGDSQNLPSQDAALGVWVFQAVFITFFCARSRVPSNAFSDLKCLSPVPIPALPPSLKPRGDQTPQTHIPTPWGGRCAPHVSPMSPTAIPRSPPLPPLGHLCSPCPMAMPHASSRGLVAPQLQWVDLIHHNTKQTLCHPRIWGTRVLCGAGAVGWCCPDAWFPREEGLDAPGCLGPHR